MLFIFFDVCDVVNDDIINNITTYHFVNGILQNYIITTIFIFLIIKIIIKES